MTHNEPTPSPDHRSSKDSRPIASGPDDQRRRRTGRRRVLLALCAAAAVLLIGGLVLFQPWRLLTRSTVDEALPVAASTSLDGLPASEGSAPTEEMPTSTATEPTTSARPALDVLSEGRFIDAEHATSGTARIVQLADGSRYLRLEGFSTSDGPDVDVWLTDQPAGGDWHRYDDRFHVSLGDLKGTDGNQNYAIPGDVDLSRVRSVAIWCDRFDVAFGTAPIRIA